ncbi:MAG: Na/Pi symporter, partial [Planctomycetes bacterium]|nr:Na/Pi symporter [Planctomycetota bacterium]
MTCCVLRCVAAAALMLTTGLCYGEEPSGNIVDKIVLREGNNDVGASGDEIALVVEVLGPSRPGMFGGKGRRLPVEGQEVVFSFRGEPTGAEFVGPSVTATDHGGKASCIVRLGPKFGDCYVRALAIGSDGKPKKAEFRVTSGIRIFGDKQEGPSGSELADPLQVQVLDSNGKAVSGIPVYFTIIEGSPNGASLRLADTVSDDEGLASTILRLPKLKAPTSTSRVYVTAEVADPNGKYVARAIHFEASALNRTVMLTTLLGALAVFIFGMKQMCDGLQRVAGEKLKWILRMFTRNRFIAITVGAVVTALIQSSSACTVMTVGFVNAGLITLTQAIGVIFGANIGTTVTGQIIAFKLTDLAYPAIAVGLIIIMVVRNRTYKFWGQAIMGFGLLFLGMTVMSGTLKPLRHFPSFAAFFQGFDCSPASGGVMPIKAVLYSICIGTAMTVIVQSSSATIGLTIALAGSGLINFYTAVPIVLGDNIGTTITAILASIGANRAARRTALAHSLFNVFGAAYMIALFYVPAFWGKGRPIFLEFVQDVTNGDVFAVSPENNERHVAMAHSIFNIF